MTDLPTPTTPEAVFTYAAPRLKFGPGAVREIGHDVAGLGGRHVLVAVSYTHLTLPTIYSV